MCANIIIEDHNMDIKSRKGQHEWKDSYIVLGLPHIILRTFVKGENTLRCSTFRHM
jgi:hypothetical protein